MKLIERLAQKYDPSLTGAIGMIGGMILLGAAVATPVAAAIGAGAAALSGASALVGAIWGGGIAAGGAAAIVSWIALPQIVYAQCYKYMLKKHVADGGSTSGMKWVPGIENIRHAGPSLAQKRGLKNIFTRGKKNTDAHAKPPAPKDNKPRQPPNP